MWEDYVTSLVTSASQINTSFPTDISFFLPLSLSFSSLSLIPFDLFTFSLSASVFFRFIKNVGS